MSWIHEYIRLKRESSFSDILFCRLLSDAYNLTQLVYRPLLFLRYRTQIFGKFDWLPVFDVYIQCTCLIVYECLRGATVCVRPLFYCERFGHFDWPLHHSIFSLRVLANDRRKASYGRHLSRKHVESLLEQSCYEKKTAYDSREDYLMNIA